MKFAKMSFLIIFIICIVLCGASCSDEVSYDKYYSFLQKPSKNLEILTSGEWEYDDYVCPHSLHIMDNGELMNYCSCGSVIEENGYMTMKYIYDDMEKKIYVYTPEGDYLSEGTVMSISETELTLDIFGEVCEYKLVK